MSDPWTWMGVALLGGFALRLGVVVWALRRREGTLHVEVHGWRLRVRYTNGQPPAPAGEAPPPVRPRGKHGNL